MARRNVQDTNTHLKTLHKLAGTMGASFVINMKARQEIFEALIMHGTNSDVVHMSVKCLKLLLKESQPDTRCQVATQIFTSAFKPLVTSLRSHQANPHVALEGVTLLGDMANASADLPKDMASPGVVQYLQSCGRTHSSQEDILLTCNQVLEFLGADKVVPSDGLLLDNEMSEWASGDLINLGAADGRATPSRNQNLFQSPARRNDAMFSKAGTGIPLPSRPQFTPAGAQRTQEMERTLVAYKKELERIKNEYTQLKIRYTADKQIYDGFVAKMNQDERRYTEEINRVKQENQSLKQELAQIQTTHQSLQMNLHQKDSQIKEKDAIIEKMSSKVGEQINAAKGHYMGVMGQLQSTKEVLDASQAQVARLRHQVAEQETSLQQKNSECTSLQGKCGALQQQNSELQQQKMKMDQETRTFRAQVSQKLQQLAQQLEQKSREAQTSAQVAEQFRQQVMKLKIQHQTMIQRYNQLAAQTAGASEAQQRLQAYEQANQQLKAKLFDLQSKNEAIGSLQQEIEQLRKDKSELIQMNEQLLDQLDHDKTPG